MTGGSASEQAAAEAFIERLALLSLRVVEAIVSGTAQQRQQLDAGLSRLEAEAGGEADLLAYVGRLRALLRGEADEADEPFPIAGPYAAMWTEVQRLWREVS